ncbi:hypothetical protein SAMN05216298_0461 [Glycomyces sambucus]|uniref:Uncharacterized protein n=1 Tax=Glycomyces sambucus TaxID=380244 RepID=A0A1G9CR14_9ACTN|nr:hypothetical protein [Glycomyces sambucus]SDK53885.1 hypothetical protein SAMN05216298_0461 [Glycomyces sambucus]
MTWNPIEDTVLVYETPDGAYATRRARLWEDPETRAHRCVLTEAADDQGMSIVDAAADVADAVEKAWGAHCAVIEHHPAKGAEPERFDAVAVDRFGEATRTPLDPAGLAAELPGLVDAA